MHKSLALFLIIYFKKKKIAIFKSEITRLKDMYTFQGFSYTISNCLSGT